MSYLNHPGIFFSGKFHADPATINNTPNNYNPNANFPPYQGNEMGNNIQLYWNPNGSGKFAFDCTVTQVKNFAGEVIEDSELLGQPLISAGGTTLAGGKLVDLDPMQQNVTELWAMTLELPDSTSIALGDMIPSAYSNAWIQVVEGRGDYAGSVQYQTVIELDDATIENSPMLQQLAGEGGLNGNQNKLSVGFVVRAYNSSSYNYLVSEETRFAMNNAGVPTDVTDKLIPIESYYQYSIETSQAGQIPTTAYFDKLLVKYLTKVEVAQYSTLIKANAVLPYTPRTEFDFTYGQVFGTIGLNLPQEPDFMTANRMLTPESVTTATDPYDAFFAPFALSAAGDCVSVNLGNSLPSTQPAAEQNSYVDTESLGELQLCYFDGPVDVANAVMLGSIDYQSNDFYLQQAGLATVAIETQDIEAVRTCPLGIISTTTGVQRILLQENSDGFYLRANQFVFRMNPGLDTSDEEPRGRTQEVEIYVRQFGEPVAGQEISIELMPPVSSSLYTDSTLGTGGSAGLVNMGTPASALSFPSQVTTDAQGVAKFTITATDPGNPRGYVDGQIYFLRYGLADDALAEAYVQGPDTLISIQVYTQQPDFADITWENFVEETLGLYGKLYPIMGFLDLEDEQTVINNAANIYQYINKGFPSPALMPVTRDLSASRLALLNRWLLQYIPADKKQAFAGG